MVIIATTLLVVLGPADVETEAGYLGLLPFVWWQQHVYQTFTVFKHEINAHAVWYEESWSISDYDQ